MGLIGIFGYLGYLNIQKPNQNSNNSSFEIDKKDSKIKLLQIGGFFLNLFDYFLICSEKASPALLYEYYLNHKILIKIIYCFGGLVLMGIFSAMIYIKSKIRNNNSQFNEVELK